MDVTKKKRTLIKELKKEEKTEEIAPTPNGVTQNGFPQDIDFKKVLGCGG